MKPDPQFPWWTLANAIGSLAAGLGVLIACSGFKWIGRKLVRVRAASLPKGPHTNRATEELEGLADEMRASERIELIASLLINSRSLHRELAAMDADFNANAIGDFKRMTIDIVKKSKNLRRKAAERHTRINDLARSVDELTEFPTQCGTRSHLIKP
jgi:hypothetical protein